ncbi:aldo/keto reductase [Sphingobium sp. HWE2-09]|uniref:aldo/keto reductase n=1 Tax=Sphingobium sp. HWE2-09 TaxID=3108390 RepID=UPI00403EB1C5
MALSRDQGVGATIWSPLGWGKLTGRISRAQPDKPGTRAHDVAGPISQVDEERLFRTFDILGSIADETGKTVPQLALNWLLDRPTVATVIVGARIEAQSIENAGAVGWALYNTVKQRRCRPGTRPLSPESRHFSLIRTQDFARPRRAARKSNSAATRRDGCRPAGWTA